MNQLSNDTMKSGYVDIQVNGYAGVDFNGDHLSAEHLSTACAAMKRDGVAQCLPTLITDEPQRMIDRLQQLVRLRDELPLAQSLIAGFHIEGPFISDRTGFIGTHPPQHARPADLELAKRLIEAGSGLVRIMTLAPERDPRCDLIKYCQQQGVIVSAGHCDPDLTTLRAAVDSGLSLFTHLGNGCPRSLDRHDNIIQRALSLEALNLTFIADGHHVPLFALANYLRTAGVGRVAIVSDAISAAGQSPGTYDLAGQRVVVDADGGTWSPDRQHLMGSAATMGQAHRLLKSHLEMNDSQLQALLHDNPARFAGIAG